MFTWRRLGARGEARGSDCVGSSRQADTGCCTWQGCGAGARGCEPPSGFVLMWQSGREEKGCCWRHVASAKTAAPRTTRLPQPHTHLMRPKVDVSRVQDHVVIGEAVALAEQLAGGEACAGEGGSG